MKKIAMKTITERIETARQDMECSIAYARETFIKAQKRIEDACMLMPMLMAEGFDARYGYSGEWLNVYLDHDAPEFGTQLAALRKMMGRMTMGGKNIEDAKANTVEIKLSPVAYPNVTIRYSTKIARKGKCKIKTVIERRKVLVCES